MWFQQLEPDESSSDWKDDPEVELAEELRGDAFQQEDRRSVTDIRSGRMLRKRTCPTPVVAPIKSTKASATITSASSEYKEDIGSDDKLHINEVEPASSSEMTDEIPSKEEPQQKLMTAENTTVEFAVNGGADCGKQELRIQQNGEDVMFMSQTITQTRSIDLNMSDSMEVNSIMPENIPVKVTSGKLVMDIKTELGKQKVSNYIHEYDRCDQTLEKSLYKDTYLKGIRRKKRV